MAVKTKKIQKVFKYGTGDPIPDDAEYLTTEVEYIQQPINGAANAGFQMFPSPQRFVWHYFLVSLEE